jgi:hypothetical protein
MKYGFPFLVLLLCLSFALAQSTSATISGGVTDPSGNFIVDADVEIANDATGVVYPAKTNRSGMYLVPILPPGHYHVQVSKAGFKTIIKADVVLNVQSAVALNFTLPLGASSESITVEEGAATINTTDGSVSTVIDRKFVENIPLNGRSFQDLIEMTPGVVTQSPQTSGQAPGALGDFSVNGQRTESNYYTVDGVTANVSGGNGGGVGETSTGGTLGASTALGTTQSLISVDALQEFRVESSTYSAEYGYAPGGQFVLVTRSGTNALHGAVFDYLRNNFFDANDWFNDHYGDPQPALRQNDFGGTLGGPVRFPRLYNGKDRTFFFASYEGLRLDQPTAATIQYVPDLFLRNQAAPALQPILNAFPVANGIDYGTSANPNLAQFIKPDSLPSSIDSTSIRVDQVISPKLTGFFRFGDTPSSTVARQDFARDTASGKTQTYTLGATSQLSRALTDEFRLGYDRSNSSDIGALDNFGGAAPVNLGNLMGAASTETFQPLIAIYFPTVGISELEPYYGINLTRQWNVVDTFNFSFGRQTLKFGVDYRHIKSPIRPVNIQTTTIYETVSSLEANQSTLSEIQDHVGATPIFDETALFVQDEWRLRPRLGLSLGLRWTVDPPPTEQHGDDAYTLLGSIGDPESLRLAPQGTPLWKTSWYDFAPRMGVAWTPHNDAGAETVIRAGGGVFFDTDNEVATTGYSDLGFESFQLSYGASLPYSPSELNIPVSTTPPYTFAVFAFPSHLQLPYTLEWNTSVQQAFGKPQSLTVSYIGASGRRLLAEQELSVAALNPDFGAGSVVEYVPSGVTSSYQALQAQFQRSIANGLQALASYTWSHAIDFGSTAQALPLQRGNSAFDVRNNFQAGLSWDLPIINDESFAHILLNGWGIDDRLSTRSAFPITLAGNEVTDPATGNIVEGGLNFVAGQPIYVRGSQYPGGRAINKSAFSLPATGIVGNAPRNFVRGFGITQLNMAVRREFPLHDALKLQFRAEAFNILNHPMFGYVDPVYTDATFGQATKMLNESLGTMSSQYQQGGARSMQFALKVRF